MYLKIKKSLKFLIYFFIIFWCSISFAQEWKSAVKMGTGDEFYVDLNSKKKNKNFVIVTVLNDYGYPDPFNKSKSSIQDIAFDCQNMRFQFLNDKFFSKQMGKGLIIQSSNRPMPVMNMPKGSAYDIISKLVC
jgi:hypothetical protein